MDGGVHRAIAEERQARRGSPGDAVELQDGVPGRRAARPEDESVPREISVAGVPGAGFAKNFRTVSRPTVAAFAADAADAALSALSAFAALGTLPSVDSLMSSPVRVLSATLRPVMVLLRMSRPRISLLRRSMLRIVLLRMSRLRIVLSLIAPLSIEPVARP